jgi:uncharacterized protein
MGLRRLPLWYDPEVPATVAALYIFPIKSLRGFSPSGWVVEKRGLRHDRRWMLIDSNGLFLSQRKLPKMALIDVELHPDRLETRAAGMPTLQIPIEPQGEPVIAQVWQSKCRSLAVSPDSDRWFSEALGMPCRLVYMPDRTRRRVPLPEAKSSDIVGYADANPILVAGEASLADLNQRLECPVEMLRFRPSIVLSGIEPFAEDEWEAFAIGEVRLRKVRRCGRCSVTTIDPATGETGLEPLRTLAAYRTFGKSACFGAYYAPDSLGPVEVGQELTYLGEAQTAAR